MPGKKEVLGKRAHQQSRRTPVKGAKAKRSKSIGSGDGTTPPSNGKADSKGKGANVRSSSEKATREVAKGKLPRTSNVVEGVLKKRSREDKAKRRKKKPGASKQDDGEKIVDGLLAELMTRFEGEAGDGSDSAEELVLNAMKETRDGDEVFESEEESDSDLDLLDDDEEPEESSNNIGNNEKATGKKGAAPSKEEFEDSSEASAESSESSGESPAEDSEAVSGGSEGSDSDEDYGNISMHKDDLESLKKSDPSFYKFLQENDAELLDMEDSDGSDGEGISEGKSGKGKKSAKRFKSSKRSAVASDEEEGSEGDDDSEDEEGQSELSEDAEEAHMSDSDEGEASKPAKSAKISRTRMVDMGTLRAVEEQLKNNRGGLKAVKELNRMLRAGRDLSGVAQESAPTKAEKTATGKAKAKLKAKERAKVKRGEKERNLLDEDSDDDAYSEDEADSGFVAGDITFASARVYQKAMYTAVVRVPETLDRILGKPKKATSTRNVRWNPCEHGRWRNVQPLFKSFVSQFLALADSMQDPGTLRFLVKRAERLVPYTRGNLRLSRQLVKLALSVWSPESRDVSEATKLRGYLLLRAIAVGVDSNVEVVLRAVYNEFSSHIGKACNPRTLPNIMFSLRCIVDLFGLDMAVSYRVAFAYLREMAVTLRSVLTSKDSKDVEKLHNWCFVNALRLWSMVISAYGSEDELHALIYPYVQVALGVCRIQSTPRTFPLRLHICSYVTGIVRETGVYVPVSAHLLPLLRCSELRKKPSAGSTKDLEWRALLRVGDDVVKTKPFLTGLLNGTLFQLSNFFSAVSRHVSFPELSFAASSYLKKFGKEVSVVEWRRSSQSLAGKLRETASLVAVSRSRAEFGPSGAAGTRGMREAVPGLDLDKKMPVERFYNVELARVKREEGLRDEALRQKAQSGTQKGAMAKNRDVSESDDYGDDDDEIMSDSDDSESDTEGKTPSSERPRVSKQVKPTFRVIDEEFGSEDGDEVGALVLSSDEE